MRNEPDVKLRRNRIG